MGTVKDLSGQKFGRLTAIAPTIIEKGNMLWRCSCDCGKEVSVRSSSLLTGKVKSCGCLRTESAKRAGKSRTKDLTGRQFGELTVIKDTDRRDTSKTIIWECRCSCGETAFVRGNDLQSGNIKSCGCKRPVAQSKAGKKHVQAILANMVENTNLAVLNSRPGKANKSGIRGVFFNKSTQKWQATLTFKGVAYRLGEFDKLEDAAKARALAEEKYFDPILEKYGKETTDTAKKAEP